MDCFFMLRFDSAGLDHAESTTFFPCSSSQLSLVFLSSETGLVGLLASLAKVAATISGKQAVAST